MKAMIVLKIGDKFKRIYKNKGNANEWFADVASKSWGSFILFAAKDELGTIIIVNWNNLDALFEYSKTTRNKEIQDE